MCGIVGIRRLDGSAPDPAILRAMAATLTHRGPDGDGFWTHRSTGFGHTRLAIIDLEGSPQPMSTDDGRVTISFNGEILNYRALRAASRYPFRTAGDTETLLARYLESGPAFLHELRGQFALAIHDDRDDRLLLARDRLGILPLYYAVEKDQLVFASEIKALLPALAQPPGVDTDALDAYLAHRSVPAPQTLFAGVRKLEAGGTLEVDGDGNVRVGSWWELTPQPIRHDLEPAEAVEAVASALDASIEDALEADVPVGAYLSGGVDSSLICALAARHGSHRLQTFSAGFDDPRGDELPFAATVSRHLDTEHHPIVLREADFEGLWHRMTWHRDGPISEPADLAVFRLAELARRDVKVVLSGEGSDELFGGYPKYRHAARAERLGVVPGRVRATVLDPLQRALPARMAKVRIAVRAAAASDTERARAWFAPFTERERARLLGPGRTIHPPPPAAGRDAIETLMLTDCGPWLSDNLLERGDRMSMAASLELRPPFLDTRLVDFALTMPSAVRTHGATTKWVVKEVARRHLPAEIVDRRKVGFRVPLDAWFRTGLRDMAGDLLLDRGSFVGEVMDRAAVSELLETHDSGRRDEEIRIWTLLSLEVWHQRFFRGVTG